MLFTDRVNVVVERIKELSSLDSPDTLGALDRARNKIDNALNEVFDNLAADIAADERDDEAMEDLWKED